MKKRNFLKHQSLETYKKKRYKNPYFRKTQPISRVKIIVLLFLFLITIILSIWFIFFSSFSRLSNVHVEGLTTIPNSFIENVVYNQMNQKRFNIFKQQSQYFFDVNSLYEELINQYDFEKLEIKLTRKSVNILATEKISEIIWKSGDRLAFINLSGEFVRDLKDFEIAQIYARLSIPTTYSYNGGESLPLQPTMPIVEDLSQEVLSSESKILGKVQPENLTVFDSSLRLIGVMPVIYQIENREAAWVRVKSDQQYDILLDCSGEVGGQLSALKTVLDDYSESLDSISYIDVRFGNHVYVK